VVGLLSVEEPPGADSKFSVTKKFPKFVFPITIYLLFVVAIFTVGNIELQEH
jgi:hypothetical protein